MGGVATFQRKLDAEGNVLTSAGVISAEAVRAVTIPVDDDRSRNRYTGYAIANPGSEGIYITGSLFDGDLKVPVSRFTISLGPGQQVSSFFFERTSLPEVFRGSAVLTAQGGKVFGGCAGGELGSVYRNACNSDAARQSIAGADQRHVIDGTGAGPLRDAVVLINDDHIAAVGPAGEVSIPANARIIDVRGATILPGFINTHVHSAFIESNLLAWAQAGLPPCAIWVSRRYTCGGPWPSAISSTALRVLPASSPWESRFRPREATRWKTGKPRSSRPPRPRRRAAGTNMVIGSRSGSHQSQPGIRIDCLRQGRISRCSPGKNRRLSSIRHTGAECR